MPTPTDKTTRAERLAQPRAREMAEQVAAEPDPEPFHVMRFGKQVDAKGVVAGTEDADRCVRYLAKYPTKDIAECHAAETGRQEQHVDQLMETLRDERIMAWLEGRHRLHRRYRPTTSSPLSVSLAR